MFSFRFDKTGFFAAIILWILLGAAVASTVCILLVGDWEGSKNLLKVVWGTWWVLCIGTVLTRVLIFGWQMKRAAERQSPPPAADDKTQPPPPDGGSEPPAPNNLPT